MILHTENTPDALGMKYVPVHYLKAYGETKVKLHSFLTSALAGGEWFSIKTLLLYLYLYPGWLGRRVGQEAVTCQEPNHDSLVFQPVA